MGHESRRADRSPGCGALAPPAPAGGLGEMGSVRTTVDGRSSPSGTDAARPLGIPVAEGAVTVPQPGVAVEARVGNAPGGDVRVAVAVVIVHVDAADRQALR